MVLRSDRRRLVQRDERVGQIGPGSRLVAADFFFNEQGPLLAHNSRFAMIFLKGIANRQQ
jgi:hypothetical protein